MNVKWLIPSLIVILIVSFLYTGLKMKNPKIVCINSPTFDWGVINEDTSTEHDFIVKNEGNTDLVIENIKTGCGCTKVEISKHTLTPNETATLKVKYVARNISNRETIAVWVKSNDKKTPIIEFLMTGLVKLSLACHPKSLSFDLSANEGVPAQILHFKTNIETFELMSCSAPDCLIVEWNKVDEEYICSVKPQPEFQDSMNQKIVTEFKVDGKIKNITIPVYILR